MIRYSYVPEVWLTQEIKDFFPAWATNRRVRSGDIVEFSFEGEQPSCLSAYAAFSERQEDS